MEAVPKLPMLSFELKVSSENTHFGPKLKQYIAEAYREDPDSYNNEMHQLESLRSAAVRPTLDSSGLNSLYRYFCQLRLIQSRFPMAKGQPAAVSFAWKDIFANMSCSLADIRFEMACILYNIGAMHSQLGALEPRNTADSLKSACTHFQKASWVFQHLKDQYPQPPGVDVSQEIVRFFQEICFAQAQECILEKSIQDTKKPSVVGAIATQVFIFYRNSLALLGPSSGQDNIHEIIGMKLYNHWFRYLSFKVFYNDCLVCLYQGMNAEELQKMGERVAFYQRAADKLAEARKLAKYIEPTDVTLEALTFTNDVVEGKKKAAKNENEFIYHEEVPEKDLLTTIKPVCLIKAIPINFNDTEITGPDIFARLVPMGAHEASSVYSEEKAKMLRHVVSLTDAKNTELLEFMSSLQIDQLDVLNSDQRIPQEIVDRCAAMNAKSDIIQTLVDSMNMLAEIISDVEHSLAEIKILIQEEAANEKEFQKEMGPRPPSIVQTELSREYNKYQEAHSRTNESNQVLHKAMTLHIANLRLLSLPLDQLHNKIPTIDNIEGLDRDKMNEMNRVVGKAREMQIQRETLVQQLREAINSDDITPQLLARTTEPLNEIFKVELEKHTPKIKIIEQNLAAQENIINKLTSIYASYGESRRLLADIIRKREALINALVTSYDTHEELLGKSQKGLEFYRRLQHNVAALHSRLRATRQVQAEERATHRAARVSSTSTPVSTSTKNVSNDTPTPTPSSSTTPKLKDYLPYMKTRGLARSITPVLPESLPSDSYYPDAMYPPSVRPAPLGSEATTDTTQMKYPDGYTVPPNPTQISYNPYNQYSNIDPNQYPGSTNYYPNTATNLNYDQQSTKQTETDGIHYTYNAGYTPTQSSQYSTQFPNSQYNTYYTASQNNACVTTVTSDSQNSQYGLGMSVSQVNPQAQYSYTDPYATMSSQYGSQSDVVASVSQYNQVDMTNSFAQMQVTVKPEKYEAQPTDYAQYYAQYPQTSTPSYNAQNVPVQAVPEYNAPNCSHGSDVSVSQSYASQPNVYSVSVPTIPQQYSYSTPSVYDSGSQNTYPSYANANNSVPNFSASGVVANQAVAEQAYSAYSPMTSEPEKIMSAVGLTNMDMSEKPIKSHVTGEALSDISTYHMYQPYNTDVSVANYTNMEPSVQSYQYSEHSNVSYQNHPGYTYNASSGNYDYNYGSQNSYESFANQSVVDSQAGNKNQMPAHSVYTNAGSYDTVQSPSENPPQTGDHVINNQLYYNSPYGYQMNVNQVESVVSANVPETTNCGSNLNQSTYMQSGQLHDTSVTYSKNQVSTTKESVPELQNMNQHEFNIPPAQNYQTNVPPAQNYQPNIPPAQNYQPNIPPVQNYQADIPPVQNYQTNVPPAQNYQTNVPPAQNYQTNVPPAQNYQAEVPPAQNYQVDVPPAQSYQADVPPAQSYQADVPPVQNYDQPQNIQGQTTDNNLEAPKEIEPPPKVSEPSTFDLLSDIDFTVEHKPLMPEIKVPQVSESSIKKVVYPKVEPTMPVPKVEDPIERPAKRDLFSDPSLLNKFTQEVKNLQKYVDSLTNKAGGGLSVLDSKWKKLQDVQSQENMLRTKTVAMQHLDGNIVTAVAPFDDSRLTLKSNPDAYINASYYKQLAPWCIPLVLSNTPSEKEYSIFWKAILENKISSIICLLSEIEIQGNSYWPTAKGQTLELDGLRVTLEDVTCTVHWTERKLTVTEDKTVLNVVHYQINVFPAKIVCSPLVLLADKILSATYDGRLSNQLGCAWIHCSQGAGRSAVVSLLLVAMCQVRAGQLDLCDMLDKACINLYKHRANVLEDTKYLADAYRTTLFYLQGVICSGTTLFNGETIAVQSGASVLPPVTPSSMDKDNRSHSKFSRESFEEMKHTHGLTTGDMKDPLNFLDPLWSLKKK